MNKVLLVIKSGATQVIAGKTQRSVAIYTENFLMTCIKEGVEVFAVSVPGDTFLQTYLQRLYQDELRLRASNLPGATTEQIRKGVI